MENIVAVLMIILAMGMLILQHLLLDKSGKAKENHRGLKRAGICVALSALFHAAALMSSDAEYKMMFQSIHLALINPFLLALTDYICSFIGEHGGRWKRLRNLTVVLVMADMVSLVLNPVFGHVFSDPFFQNSSAYAIRKAGVLGPGFAFHLVVSYVMLIYMGWLLLDRIKRAEPFYRKKYICVLEVLAIGAFMDLVYLLFAAPVNISLLVYMIMMSALPYISFIYVPKSIMEETAKLTMWDSNDGVICFDIDGECVYANNMAYDFMGLQADRDTAEDLKEVFNDWIISAQEVGDENTYYVFMMPLTAVECYYDIKKSWIKSRAGEQIGVCYTLYDRTEEILMQRQERYVATIDSLTGLYNRDTFYKKMQELLKACPDEDFVLLHSNFQDFKLVNELFGNEKGDEILSNYADILKEQWGEEAVCSRIEDDHFMVCIRKADYSEETVRDVMELSSQLIGSNTFRLQVYVGVYDITDHNMLITAMCDRARMALASIKGDYITKIGYYRDDMRKNVIHEKALVSEFGEALIRGDFKMYLQAQADQNGHIDGAEALVRWEHPEKGMIMPGVFIDLFERTGTIAQLDHFIWEEACKKLKEWKILGFNEYHISVNISAKDFSYTDIYETMVGLVEKYEIDPVSLRLEITETALMSDFRKNLSVLERLHQYGFIVEIDDFGSGYSSLNMLKDIKADMLKIDMMFLRKTENEERSRIILGLVIDLAKRLGMSVLTEGVETKDQLDYLIEEGCDFFQGYYFEKPIPVIEFEKKYMGYGVRESM